MVALATLCALSELDSTVGSINSLSILLTIFHQVKGGTLLVLPLYK